MTDEKKALIYSNANREGWVYKEFMDAPHEPFDYAGMFLLGEWPPSGSGPHRVVARNGEWAYCGGPGRCEVCDKELTEP